MEKFKEMIQAQSGDTDYIDNPDKFPQAKHIRKLPAPKRGYVHTINAGLIAEGVQKLAQANDGTYDPCVGVSEIKKSVLRLSKGSL